MSLAAVVTLLQTALSLVLAVHSVPNVPQSLIDTANATAQQAMRQATLALAQSPTAGTAASQTVQNPASNAVAAGAPVSGSGDIWSAFGTNAGSAASDPFAGTYAYSPTADTLLQALQSPTPQMSAGTPAANLSTPCRAANGSSFSAGSTVGACLVPGSGTATCAGSTQYMCIGGEWTAQ